MAAWSSHPHRCSGNSHEIYGRKADEKQKNKLYHPNTGPIVASGSTASKSPVPTKRDNSGAFNHILTESIIDALAFESAAHKVTCIYGTEGFNDEHLQAFKAHKTQRIYLAYDPDDKAGDRAAERDAQQLQAIGIECT